MITMRFRPFADYSYADEMRFKQIREQLRQEMQIEVIKMTKKEAC